MTIRVVLTEQLINSLMDKKSESINIILQAKLSEIPQEQILLYTHRKSRKYTF